MKEFKLGVCQMPVTEEKERNLEKAYDLIREAAGLGANLIVLPEMFNCPFRRKFFKIFAEEYPQGETIKCLSSWSREFSVYLVGGSIPESAGDKIYNSSFIYDPRGELLGRFRKVHLFDIDLPNGFRFYESDVISPGEELQVFTTPWGKVGVVICYDLRFPELLRAVSLQEVFLIVAPASFNINTGKMHWDMLLKARAVDNQVFLTAAATARQEEVSFVSYAHSRIVDPWGKVVADAGTGEKVIVESLSPEKAHQIRQRLPLLQHRRPGLYKKWLFPGG